jgi:hypothetical protein
LVSTTSSVLGVHEPLLIVHRKVAELPAGTPVTPELGAEGDVIVAVPETTDHNPVPTLGVLAAIVKLPLLQFAWSLPALDVVGGA